ncbi:MAG: AsmA-like C-terminal domain-containing protein [Rhodospirillaceae bacterium]|nr:AsmA-like C-terminal domain-containing protein [Rhodospirillaceae bacterium]
MAELSLPALKAFWPADVKVNTRNWINANLNDGGLTDTRLKLRLTGPSMKDIDATEARLTSQLHGVTVQYMKGMPKVEGTDGLMTIGAKDVTIDVTAGHVPDAIGKGLRVPSGKVRLYNLGSSAERANIKLKIAGGFGDVMRLIDNPPLGYAKSVGLDANRAAGDADVDLTLDFPLVNDLRLDALKLAVAAKVNGVGIPEVAFGLPLSDGRMAVTLDRDGMDVAGTAALGGIQTAVKWRENFSEKGGRDFRSRYELDPVVDNAQRPLVGLGVMPFIPPYIDGAVPAHVIYTVRRDATRTLDADIDLTAPAMAIPELGWRKAPGTDARARVSATFLKDRLDAVPSFHVISGDDLDISGALEFGENGKMRLLSIKPSVVGETRLSGAVTTDEAGAYTIDVAGAAFNSTYFWKELSRDDTRGKAPEGGEKTPATPMTIRANFDRMWLTKDGDFRDVKLAFARDTTGIQEIDFSSKVDGDTPFTFKLTPADGKRGFKGSSASGGSVVRAIGLFGDIVGGQLEIDGEFAPDGAIKGTAEIQQFKLVEAPLLARLLSVASLTGIVDELSGKGISFKTLRVPFSYANATLSIKDGEMFGSSLGLTGEGTYNFSSSNMNFDGTLIPAYALNSALNSIPLLGAVLSGGDKGGGIFAATYSYRGPVATAQPSVNPLAALTPGFLRHIFDIFKPAAPQEARTPEKAVEEAPKAKE